MRSARQRISQQLTLCSRWTRLQKLLKSLKSTRWLVIDISGREQEGTFGARQIHMPSAAEKWWLSRKLGYWIDIDNTQRLPSRWKPVSDLELCISMSSQNYHLQVRLQSGPVITETDLKLLTYYDFIIDHPYLSLIIISLSSDKALALGVSSCWRLIGR